MILTIFFLLGLLLFGRSPKKARQMEHQIRNRQVSKEYVCRVEGEFPEWVLYESHDLSTYEFERLHCDPKKCGKPLEVACKSWVKKRVSLINKKIYIREYEVSLRITTTKEQRGDLSFILVPYEMRAFISRTFRFYSCVCPYMFACMQWRIGSLSSPRLHQAQDFAVVF